MVQMPPLKVNSNANTTWGSAINLSGTIQPGETFVVVNASEAAILALSDQTTGSLSFNGDDAIGLFKDNALIDIFGVFSEDPGTEWTLGDFGTADSSVIRNPSVVGPYVGGTTEAPEWNIAEWTSFDDSVSTLGSHTVNPE
jgi:hypothetical protein